MKTKIIAKLTKWNGEIVEQEIKKDWIQPVVDAVVGQFLFVDKESGLCIVGYKFAHVDIYEVKA